MLLRKAFKLACNGSNLSKGRAGNSILFESCFLLSKQERGTSKKEKLHSNLASQYTHLVFGVIQSLKKKEGSRNGDLTVDFTSLDEFRVDVEAAGGDITCRCCQWSFLKAGTRTVPFPQPIIGVPGLITPLHCSTLMLAIIKRHSHQTKYQKRKRENHCLYF